MSVYFGAIQATERSNIVQCFEEGQDVTATLKLYPDMLTSCMEPQLIQCKPSDVLQIATASRKKQHRLGQLVFFALKICFAPGLCFQGFDTRKGQEVGADFQLPGWAHSARSNGVCVCASLKSNYKINVYWFLCFTKLLTATSLCLDAGSFGRTLEEGRIVCYPGSKGCRLPSFPVRVETRVHGGHFGRKAATGPSDKQIGNNHLGKPVRSFALR